LEQFCAFGFGRGDIEWLFKHGQENQLFRFFIVVFRALSG
jgi:hypothetical protein